MPNAFREELISQIPALQLLINLGYTYLPPEEALAQRGGKFRHVLLEEVLLTWLRQHMQSRPAAHQPVAMYSSPCTHRRVLTAIQASQSSPRLQSPEDGSPLYNQVVRGSNRRKGEHVWRYSAHHSHTN